MTKDSDREACPPGPRERGAGDPGAREAILARRRRFVASALATFALGSCDRNPLVCLEIALPPSAHTTTTTSTAASAASATSAAPLEPPRPGLDAQPPEQGQTGAPSTAPPEPTPRVCLSRPRVCLSPPIAPPPPPRVCLRKATP